MNSKPYGNKYHLGSSVQVISEDRHGCIQRVLTIVPYSGHPYLRPKVATASLIEGGAYPDPSNLEPGSYYLVGDVKEWVSEANLDISLGADSSGSG